jgi:hypothetical protein
MRWTRQRQAQSLRRRMMLSRTAKSCGSGAPMQALKLAERSADDGGNQAWSPGRSRISRKTIAQGMPAVAVYPWLLTPVLFSAQAATGATRIRHSLRPLYFEGGSFPTPRTFRAARTRSHAPSPSCSAKAGHPVHRGLSTQAPTSLEYWIVRSSRTTTSECAEVGAHLSPRRPRKTKPPEAFRFRRFSIANLPLSSANDAP